MRNGTRPRRAGLVGIVALLAAASGCGGVGEVTGKVTYQGKPVVTGSVAFYGPDKVPHIGGIDNQGNYRVTEVPSGTCQVTVASPDPTPAMPGGKSGKPSNPNSPPGAPEPKVERPEGWRPIPPSFAELQSSKLTYQVKSGSNTIDIVVE